MGFEKRLGGCHGLRAGAGGGKIRRAAPTPRPETNRILAPSMNLQKRLALALPFLAAAPLVLTAHATTQDVTAASAAQEEDPLHDAMAQVQSGMRTLGRSMRAADGQDAALEAVLAMRDGLVASLGTTPDYPADMTDATEQRRFRNEFQRMLVATLGATLELEAALMKGDKDQAQALFAKLRAQKSEGHERFQVEEDE